MPSDELSGQKLDLAVATKLGFNLSPDGKTGCWLKTGPFIKVSSLPGYSWDLNAMAEAERVYVIPNKLSQQFMFLLDDECGKGYGVIHATATQRAVAFLKLP